MIKQEILIEIAHKITALQANNRAFIHTVWGYIPTVELATLAELYNNVLNSPEEDYE